MLRILSSLVLLACGDGRFVGPKALGVACGAAEGGACVAGEGRDGYFRAAAPAAARLALDVEEPIMG